MQIVITNNVYSERFAEIVINYLRNTFRRKCVKVKCAKWDEYLNEHKEEFVTANIQISAYEILLSALYNLDIMAFHDKTIICINQNAKLRYFRSTLLPLCNLITYGNLEVNGYPILQECFDEVQKQLVLLYNMYIVKSMRGQKK